MQPVVSTTATLKGAALTSTAVVSTTARGSTPDDGITEASEGKLTSEKASTSKGESTAGGGSGALVAVPSHHQDKGPATSGITEKRMATTGAAAAV